jgi:thiopurine S-methyltransferase
MTTEFWLQNWQDNKIGFHQQQTNSYLTTYWQHLNLASNCCVFVPLCGKSLDLLWLRQQGHSVVGVEISARAASDFFTANGLNPNSFELGHFHCHETECLTLLQGDFFDLTPQHVENVEGVFDRASLVALPIELRQQYAQHLKNILPNTAKILLVTFEYGQTEMTGPPFSVSEAEVHELYGDTYGIELLLKQDVLDIYPHFKTAGLTGLQEKVYLLTPY